MRVSIVLPTRDSQEIDLPELASVSDARSCVAEQLGVPADRVRLILRGEELKTSSRRLSACGVSSGSSLHVVLRPPGAAARAARERATSEEAMGARPSPNGASRQPEVHLTEVTIPHDLLQALQRVPQQALAAALAAAQAPAPGPAPSPDPAPATTPSPSRAAAGSRPASSRGSPTAWSGLRRGFLNARQAPQAAASRPRRNSSDGAASSPSAYSMVMGAEDRRRAAPTGGARARRPAAAAAGTEADAADSLVRSHRQLLDGARAGVRRLTGAMGALESLVEGVEDADDVSGELYRAVLASCHQEARRTALAVDRLARGTRAGDGTALSRGLDELSRQPDRAHARAARASRAAAQRPAAGPAGPAPWSISLGASRRLGAAALALALGPPSLPVTPRGEAPPAAAAAAAAARARQSPGRPHSPAPAPASPLPDPQVLSSGTQTPASVGISAGHPAVAAAVPARPETPAAAAGASSSETARAEPALPPTVVRGSYRADSPAAASTQDDPAATPPGPPAPRPSLSREDRARLMDRILGEILLDA